MASSVSNNSVECAICLGDVPKQDQTTLKTCTHKFCKLCIKNWKKQARNENQDPSCPMCRATFATPDLMQVVAAAAADVAPPQIANAQDPASAPPSRRDLYHIRRRRRLSKVSQ